ncbi:hypothetical protein GMDG_00940 [Pseudogymnoascus destructans 20631-21]|uniref:Uncharacterized protein n=1 Tax=Pseudogymnoascus destructans (strain ATCC MYA-4855 / 20631-21) TaxID=658429 RepID=L8FQ48_PSED2|nr:hypothetical protein GMDG_00940 [Pseudogymnoascus destructans 20631-21]
MQPWLNQLHKEEGRLEAEEEAAASQEREAHLCTQEAYACHMRLPKQQKALKTRGVEMLRHGLKSLDELEELEERERHEAEARSLLLTASEATSEGDASKCNLFPSLPSGFFDCWDGDGEMPLAALDS